MGSAGDTTALMAALRNGEGRAPLPGAGVPSAAQRPDLLNQYWCAVLSSADPGDSRQLTTGCHASPHGRYVGNTAFAVFPRHEAAVPFAKAAVTARAAMAIPLARPSAEVPGSLV